MTPAGKITANVLCPLIIIVSGIVGFGGLPGSFFPWGYLVAISIAIAFDLRMQIFLCSGLSVLFIVLPALFASDTHQSPFQVQVFALSAIGISTWLFLRTFATEKRTSENKRQMEEIFSNGTQGIILCQNNGAIRLMNPFSAQMFGYRAKELLGKHIKVVMPGLDIGDEGSQQITKATGRNEYLAVKKDTTTFPVEVTLNDYSSRGEEYVVAFITDITGRKQDEQRLIEKKKELEGANQELEAFCYSVSHDLRAPLRAIAGYAQMLDEDYNKVFDEEGKRLLSVIGESAEQMGNLIDDLLAFSRLGKKELRKTFVDMSRTCGLSLFEINKITRHKAQVTIGELHPAMADPVLMSQVMTNLLSNAIKYSSKVDAPRIEIRSVQKEAEVVYSISDNGAGFNMQYVGKLFGVFQRLHSSADFEGTGVGLAIAQRIVQKHGGRIWAHGEVGRGATFYFSLPASANAFTPHADATQSITNKHNI